MLFNDVHTYLLISFIVMAFMLYKYTHKKAADAIQEKIDLISNLIADAEKRKDKAEIELRELNRSVVDIEEIVNQTISRAKIEAEKISTSSNEKIKVLLGQKEREYNVAIEKIRQSTISDLQEKIVRLTMKKVVSMINDCSDKQLIQNISIEKSIKMLENEHCDNEL